MESSEPVRTEEAPGGDPALARPRRADSANLLEKDPTSPELVVGAVRFGEQHPDYEVEGDPLNAGRMLRDSVSWDTGTTPCCWLARSSRRRAVLYRRERRRGRGGLRRGRRDGSSTDGEATTVIASFSSQADYNRSVKYQAALLETLEGLQADEAILRGVAAQLAKLHIAVDDNESAEAIADRYFVEVENDSNQLTILGTIAFGKADAIRRSEGIAEDGGLSSEVVDLLGLAESRYDRAIELNALNPMRVQLSTLKEYEWLYAVVERAGTPRGGDQDPSGGARYRPDDGGPAAARRSSRESGQIGRGGGRAAHYIEPVPDSMRHADPARDLSRDGRTKEAIEARRRLLTGIRRASWAFALGRCGRTRRTRPRGPVVRESLRPDPESRLSQPQVGPSSGTSRRCRSPTTHGREPAAGSRTPCCWAATVASSRAWRSRTAFDSSNDLSILAATTRRGPVSRSGSTSFPG